MARLQTLQGLLPAAIALSAGTLGGVMFSWAGLPLPWMLGAMTSVTICALAGLRVALPRQLRGSCITVLGVMLGASFTPAVIARMGEWGVTLAALLVWGLISGAAGWLYFRRHAGFDPITSYFAAAPGGLNEMTLVGAQLGGDERRISLVHATRVFVAVFSIPIWLRLQDGVAAPTGGTSYVTLASVGLDDYLILGGCAVVGAFVAGRLRIPAAGVIGPMLLSAAVHLLGITDSAPPTLILSAAQVVVGATLGCRFVGYPLAQVGRTILHGAVAGAIMVAFALAASVLLAQATGIRLATILLGFAPGGLAEMSLVAIALGVDAAFVATHHLARIVLVVLCATPLFRILGLRR